MKCNDVPFGHVHVRVIFLVTYQQFVRSVVSMDTKRVEDAQNV